MSKRRVHGRLKPLTQEERQKRTEHRWRTERAAKIAAKKKEVPGARSD